MNRIWIKESFPLPRHIPLLYTTLRRDIIRSLLWMVFLEIEEDQDGYRRYGTDHLSHQAKAFLLLQGYAIRSPKCWCHLPYYNKGYDHTI